jgi:hypothetical protein
VPHEVSRPRPGGQLRAPKSAAGLRAPPLAAEMLPVMAAEFEMLPVVAPNPTIDVSGEAMPARFVEREVVLRDGKEQPFFGGSRVMWLSPGWKTSPKLVTYTVYNI